MCTARTKIVAHVKYPLSTFAKEKACNGRWYENTQITRNGSRTIKIFAAATANGRRQTDRLRQRQRDIDRDSQTDSSRHGQIDGWIYRYTLER